MAQARRVPIPIWARITGASLTTSTKSIRSTYDAPAAGHPGRSIPLELVVSGFVPDGDDAHERAVETVAWRDA
jgi:hypothetical protein